MKKRVLRKASISTRLTAILAAAVLAAGMAGCASSDSEADENSNTETSSIETLEETEDTENRAENGEDAAEAKENDGADSTAYTGDMDELSTSNTNTKLQIEVKTEESDATPEGEQISCACAISNLSIQNTGYEDLQKALDADHTEALELMSEQVADLYADFGDTAENTTAAETGYAVEDTIYLKRADEKVVSYLHCNYCSFGGAHPSTSYSSRNYDPETGAEVTLRRVVTDYDALYQYVLEQLKEQQSENGYFFDDYETSVGQIFYGPNGAPENGSESSDSEDYISTAIWYLVDDELKIVMDTYSIAPYAVGPTVIEVPFSTGLICEDYE